MSVLAVGAAADFAHAGGTPSGVVCAWGFNQSGQTDVPSDLGLAKAVTGGDDFSLALLANGTVRGWGLNGSQQCDVPAGLVGVVAISAGAYHGMALQSDGVVVCWGTNTSGQLDVPFDLGAATAISAGSIHSMALDSSGVVWCWGDNHTDQCNVPVGLGTAIGIAAGLDHSAAIKSNGDVQCWGLNDLGQLNVPATLHNVTKIASGAQHMLALTASGAVVAWGDNSHGEATVPANLGTAVAIAAGMEHSMALLADGTVRAWGQTLFGACTPPAGLSNVIGIGVGGRSSLALVQNATAPTITLVSSTPTTCGMSNGAIDITVTDADSVAWTGPNGFTSSSVDLTDLAAGSYSVTATGAGGTASQDVTVGATADTIAPVIASYTPSGSSAALQNCTAAVPDFTASVVASDNCTARESLVITQSPAAGAFVSLGATTVTITVTDASGNSAHADATFTVTGSLATYYRDSDGDGYGATTPTSNSCAGAPAGYVASSTDCNDANAAIHPGAIELCNGIDDDCVGGVDNGLTFVDYYTDADGDNYGAGSATSACAPIAGKVTSNNDCNDANGAVHPGAVEVCDAANTDEDCNGLADNADSGATGKSSFYADNDGDTYGAGSATLACDATGNQVANNADCDDANGAVHPGATELCNGIDDDCNGTADNGLTFVDYYTDGDSDGYGAGSATSACAPIAGKVTDNTDCNDANGAVHPGATELCNGIDDDCNGTADNGLAFVDYYADGDSDGYGAGSATSACAPIAGKVANNNDCNDANGAVHPGATELCNGIDDDCNGAVDNGLAFVDYYTDGDSDGYGAGSATSACAPIAGKVTNNTDCNDTNGAVHPGATELCNGIDDDCNGTADNGLAFVDYYADGDSDGYGAGSATSACAPIAGKVTNNTDCNDANSAVHPGATELCNNIDDDCVDGADNGLTFTNYYADADGDGYGSSTGSATSACAPIAGKVANNTDCNDLNTSINPGATEVCDGVDNNCVGGVDEGVQLTFYPDNDGDGFGNLASPLLACSAPAGYVTDHTDCDDTRLLYADVDSDGHGAGAPVACGVRSNDDHCPTDPAKLTPGACGCGHPDDANGDGTIDCAGTTLSMARITPPLVAGCPMIVRVSSSASQSMLAGLQLAVRFDTSHLRLDAVNPVEGGPFSMEIVEQIDNAAGTLRYAVGVDETQTGTNLASDLVDLVFTVLDTNPLCGASDLVQFTIVDGFDTELGTMAGGGFAPLVVDLPTTNLDCVIPVLSGVPSDDIALATDAGSTYGAFVAAPTVTAFDNCDGPVGVALLLTYPDSSTSTAWPSDSMFPIGTSTVRYTAVDSSGNIATESYTIDVADYQLLDASITFQGALVGSSTRLVSIKTGSLTQIVTVSLTGSSGTVTGVHVPVALGYSCMSAKDAVHSLTDIDSPVIVGKRYGASFTLLQGDSNDDNLIDIFDFSLFAADRGFGKATDARSNFNADTLVNNCDFTFICINFFKVGQSCSGAYDGAQPVARVSVKELRRTGRGNLAVADINHDGWVDTADMQLLLEGGRADGSIDQPVKIERPRAW